MKTDWVPVVLVVGVLGVGEVLCGVLIWHKSLEPVKSENEFATSLEPDPNWSDKIIADDRKALEEYKSLVDDYRQCGESLKFAVTALQNIVAAHPEMQVIIAATRIQLEADADAGEGK